MRAVVTGCAGFIGSHLCERLVAEGWNIVGVDAFTDFYSRAEKDENLAGLRNEPHFALVEADLTDGASWLRSLVRGAGAVFHLAAQPGVRGSFGPGFARYAMDNVVATQLVFEAAREEGCHRVVWASSSSVYGDLADYPTHETAPTRPVSPYGVTKRSCEHLADIYRDLGVSIVGLRYFTVYGPRQRPDMAMRRLCDAAHSGNPFPLYGNGRQSRDFTHVLDAVDATIRCAAASRVEPVYNVGGGEEATLADVIALVEELADCSVALDRHEGLAGDVTRTAADTSLARTSLGWRPRVGLREGLATELEWARGRLVAPRGP